MKVYNYNEAKTFLLRNRKHTCTSGQYDHQCVKYVLLYICRKLLFRKIFREIREYSISREMNFQYNKIQISKILVALKIQETFIYKSWKYSSHGVYIQTTSCSSF